MLTALTKDQLRNTKLSRDHFLETKRLPIYVVLDSLKCAHNIGTILRLADALLVTRVYLSGQTITPPNFKIKKGSRGSEKWVPWEYVADPMPILQGMKNRGVQIVSAELTEQSVDYRMIQYQAPVCLILGREYDGVGKKLLELSDTVVSLPIFGMTNSLNVSTVASVLLYDIYRQIA